MCGLTGYFLLDSHESSSSQIKEMLLLQKHRGPDDSGIAAINLNESTIQEGGINENLKFSNSPNLLFGFNRLSILDLSENGHQPMLSANGNVVLMMNGEIYNAFDYKQELSDKGYRFKSQTDTEVALCLYCEYGIEGMLERLNGMFAFAIADLDKKELYLARDRFGIKPLYYSLQKDKILFSSEIKSFKAVKNFKFILDDTKLSEFLLFRNAINNTLLQNVQNLIPGTYLRITEKGKIESKEYYSINNEGKEKLNDASSDLENGIRESVKKQLISDVKLGCQLSGGVDSSLVTYYAKKNVKENLETVSIIFDDENFSEKKYIDYVVADLNLVSHQFKMDEEYYFSKMNDATWHFEQPINHPNTLGIYLLSKEAKKHVTVLLSGEGADEILAGYSRFIKNARNIFTPKIILHELYKNRFKLNDLLKYYFSRKRRIIMSSSFGTIGMSKKLFKKFSYIDAINNRLNIYNGIKDTSKKVERKYEVLSYLPDLLMRQDKMSMAHSIENRVPFLDNNLVSVALNISDNELVSSYKGNLVGKKTLKDICANTFSEKFAYRPKMGFSIPLKKFFNSNTFKKQWEDDIFLSIKERNIFNAEHIAKIYSNLSKASNLELETLWIMYSFEVWAKQYLD